MKLNSALRLALASVLALCLCGPQLGCKRGKASKGKKKGFGSWRKGKKRARPIHAVRIKRGNIESKLSGTCTLTAEDQVTIVTQVSGLVRRVYGREGRKFRRGATLAILSNPYLKIAFEKAKLQVSKLKRDLQRNQRLVRKGLVSKQTSEELHFQLAQAQNALKRAQEDLRNLRIRATIYGAVTTRHLRLGAWVTPQNPAFVMESYRSLVAVIAVPEKYMPRLRLGLEAKIRAEALGAKAHVSGKVIRIAPTIDSKTGTIAVTIGKLKPRTSLRSGMFLTAHLILERRNHIPLVPKQAVQYTKNKPFVYKLEGRCKPQPLVVSGPPSGRSWKRKGKRGRRGRKWRRRQRKGKRGRRSRRTGRRAGRRAGAKSDCKAVKVHFTKGLEDASFIEIRSGLKPGDRVVTLGQQGLQKDSKVRVIKLE